MRISRKVLAVMASLVLSTGFLLSSCGSTFEGYGELHLVSEGKLTIGSDCDYPPFISMDGDTPVGFEIELMQAIADDMGLELVYLPPQNFDTLVASVAGQGKMDLAVSSMTINDERLKDINFCKPYCTANQAFVTLSSKPYTSYSDFANLTIGAQSGTTGEDWANENLPNATVKGFNQTSEGLAALRAGEIEALVFDEPVASYQITTAYNDCKIIDVIPTGEQYGFAVSKDNPELEQAVNVSLQKLIDDGTLNTLFRKYFDFDPGIK